MFTHAWIRLALVAAGTLCLAPAAAAAEGPSAPTKYALLVGCTQYPNHPRLRPLYGPANDVPLWTTLLTDSQGFAFPREHVTQLVGWPPDEAKRPTYANIVKGFEDLIARAGPDSRVVIALSGHGIQTPIPSSQKDPLDPRNPEPDGLDEVFLPADVGDWTESGLKNAITDDQIGAWLDQLRAKGAHVLIVFDCCHAGTMTRGGPGVREINRTASPEELGIQDAALRDAAARAKKAVAEAKKAGRPVPGEVVVKEQAKTGRGSLVAFYAAQPFEEAPELPFPDDAPMLRENYYGMLSWTLVQALRSRQSPLSYGELQRLVSAGYRSSRGTRPPTPFAEGDLNREVLGLNVWPNRPALYVERDKKGRLSLPAGSLHGLTKDSVLAVLPPPNDPRDPKTVLGYLRVETVTPSSATVVPTRLDPDAKESPLAPDKVPSLARCEVVRRDFGDLRVKLFTRADAVKAALARLAPEVKELVRLLPDENEPDAEWVLRVVTAAEAEREYGIRERVPRDQVFLVHGEGRTRLATEKEPAGRPRKVFGQYPVADAKALVGALERDLPKIFKWENLWRVAGGVSAAGGGANHGLTVEVLKLKDENDPQGEPLRDGVLKDGQAVLFRARNGGPQPLWVSAFLLEANLHIRQVYSAGVNRGETVTLAQGTATTEEGSAGLGGVVVFAVPQAAVAAQPNFAMLEQEPLKVAEARSRSAAEAPRSPFGKLLSHAAFHRGTRGFDLQVPSTPAIITQSWVLVP